MKIAARRRLAVGVVATTSALLAGVLIAPASTAAPNGLSITPSGASNGDNAAELTFNTTEADLRFGGEAIFTLSGTNKTFTVDIPGPDVPGPGADRSESAVVDFTDVDDDASGNTVGIDGPADAGIYSVVVNGSGDPTGELAPGGSDSCTNCFTVLEAGELAVNSVAPNSLRPGQAGEVSVLGNNFERLSRIEILFPDSDSVDTTVTTNNPPLDADGDPVEDGITTRTELKRRFSVAAGSQAGVRDVRVVNHDGGSAICADCFFVSGAELTGANPTAGFNDPGQTLQTITFTGTQIAENGQPRLEFVGNPGSASRSQLTIVGQNVRDRTGTSITADYELANAAPGSYQPFVQGDAGVVNACQTSCRFSVLQREARTPTLTSLDRSDAGGVQKDLAAGSTADFTATGTNFSRGATLVFAPPAGLTVTAVEFISPEQLRVTIAASRDTAPGDKDVTVRLTDGKTSPVCDNCLTVTAAGATSSPGAPTSGASTSAAPSSSASATASPTPGGRSDARYRGLNSPVRVLDTRANRGQRVRGEQVLDLSQRISDNGATSAVLNVTVTNPTARGFLVAYPNGNTKPGTSNVNFELNQTQANEVVVAMSSNRRVSLFVDSASAHVIVDLVGFFTTTSSAEAGRVTTSTPARALDSRTTSTPRRSGEVVVDLRSQLPSGATDAILNVTVQGPNERGFVVAYPTGTQRPETSNVNFERGQTQANEVVTRVGTGDNAGRVSLFINKGTTALIVDVVGAVTGGSTAGTQVYTALAQPARALDTRSNRGSRRSGAFDAQLPGAVPTEATGVVLNVTATNGTRSGFVAVYPAGTPNPGTSNVNFPGERAATRTAPASAGTQANEVITRLGANRSVTLFVGGRDGVASHVIVDVVGYLTESGASASPGASGGATPSASASCTPSSNPLFPRSCPTATAGASGAATPSATAATTATTAPTASTTARPSGAATTAPTASPTATTSAEACFPGPPPLCR